MFSGPGSLKTWSWASLVALWLRICLPVQETQVQSLVRKIPWKRKWQPTPVFLPETSHGQKSLAGYSPWGRKELDTTKHKNEYSIMQRSHLVYPSIHGHMGSSTFSVQFSSVQLLSRVQLCNPMNRRTPGLPVHHQLPESTQTHVH